jgi:uncharacterized protein
VTEGDIRAALGRYKNVAVLGAHDREGRAAHYVPRYMAAAGYDVYPVNPVLAGKTLFGRPVVGTLAELNAPIDIVNVFRRSEHLPGHLGDILSLDPPPKLVWLQLGVRNADFARALQTAGISLVEDRCLMIDHQRLL